MHLVEYPQGTWFYPGLGNCGKTDKKNATIVALATKTYAKGSHCDQVSLFFSHQIALSGC